MSDDIGHVYVMSNPALAGMVKIGHTKRVEPEGRAVELSAFTAIPLPFAVEYSWFVEHSSAWEAKIHRQLSSCRVSRDREFFRIEPVEAISIINSLIYGTENLDDALTKQFECLLKLYNKYPNSFKKSERFAAKLEALLAEPDHR